MNSRHSTDGHGVWRGRRCAGLRWAGTATRRPDSRARVEQAPRRHLLTVTGSGHRRSRFRRDRRPVERRQEVTTARYTAKSTGTWIDFFGRLTSLSSQNGSEATIRSADRELHPGDVRLGLPVRHHEDRLAGEALHERPDVGRRRAVPLPAASAEIWLRSSQIAAPKSCSGVAAAARRRLPEENALLAAGVGRDPAW